MAERADIDLALTTSDEVPESMRRTILFAERYQFIARKRRAHADPAHAWLRAQVIQAVSRNGGPA